MTQTQTRRAVAPHTPGNSPGRSIRRRFANMGALMAFAAVLLTAMSPQASAAPQEKAKFEISNWTANPVHVQLALFLGDLTVKQIPANEAFFKETVLAPAERVKWTEAFQHCNRVKSGRLLMMDKTTGDFPVIADVVVRTVKVGNNCEVTFDFPKLEDHVIAHYKLDVVKNGNTVKLSLDED